MDISYIALNNLQIDNYSELEKSLKKIANIVLDNYSYYNYFFDIDSPEYVYLRVLSGRLCRFPRGFWDYDFEKNCYRILNFLVNDILNLPTCELFKIYNSKFTKAVKLASAQKMLNDSPFELLRFLYPNLSPAHLYAYSHHNGYRCQKIKAAYEKQAAL